MKTISAADANRHFSALLRQASAGEVVTVLSRGRPVATVGPANAGHALRQSAKASLLKRLRAQTPSGTRNWTRAELYD